MQPVGATLVEWELVEIADPPVGRCTSSRRVCRRPGSADPTLRDCLVVRFGPRLGFCPQGADRSGFRVWVAACWCVEVVVGGVYVAGRCC